MHEDKAVGFVMGLIFGVVVTFFLGGAWAFHEGKEEIRKQAVEKGYGRWIVNEKLEVAFEWTATKSEGK